MPDPTRPCEETYFRSRCVVKLSCDSKLKITKDLITQTQDHTAPLNSRLKITQQLLTQPNSSESRDALGYLHKTHPFLAPLHLMGAGPPFTPSEMDLDPLILPHVEDRGHMA